MERLKGYLRNRWPNSFSRAKAVKDQIVVESKVIRQLGLLPQFPVRRRWSWVRELPLQKPLDVHCCSSTETLTHVVQDAVAKGLPIFRGGHTVYLPPQTLSATALGGLAARYPPNVGLKIVRNSGGIQHSAYLHGKGHSFVQRLSLHDHQRLTLVANLLTVEGIGPRVYDLLEIRFAQFSHAAYAVADVSGTVPTMGQRDDVIRKLQTLEEAKLIRLSTPGGYTHTDFGYPDCNGNCIVSSADGKPYYVDFQNFVLCGYSRRLSTAAKLAASDTHFGDRSLLRGGRYLYQSIPGIPQQGKRDVEKRASVISRLLREAGVSVDGRLILDFGCNLGMMMAQYLRMGAYWCHGWDRKDVLRHTETLLMLTGCTRFSLSAADIDANLPVRQMLPSFLTPALDGSIISYLAVRGHFGWLTALRDIDWSALIYEGHEGEDSSSFATAVAQLSQLRPVRVAARHTSADGDSRPRVVAIILPG